MKFSQASGDPLKFGFDSFSAFFDVKKPWTAILSELRLRLIRFF